MNLARTLVTAGAFVLLSSLAAAPQSGSTDEHPALPPGEGRDLMIRVCSQCHSPDVAADQQLDQAGWKTVVEQMASRGAAATDEEFDQIVQYLAKAFPPAK
jgi:mono/diheme cytochrome c family protein